MNMNIKIMHFINTREDLSGNPDLANQEKEFGFTLVVLGEVQLPDRVVNGDLGKMVTTTVHSKGELESHFLNTALSGMLRVGITFLGDESSLNSFSKALEQIQYGYKFSYAFVVGEAISADATSCDLGNVDLVFPCQQLMEDLYWHLSAHAQVMHQGLIGIDMADVGLIEKKGQRGQICWGYSNAGALACCENIMRKYGESFVSDRDIFITAYSGFHITLSDLEIVGEFALQHCDEQRLILFQAACQPQLECDEFYIVIITAPARESAIDGAKKDMHKSGGYPVAGDRRVCG